MINFETVNSTKTLASYSTSGWILLAANHQPTAGFLFPLCEFYDTYFIRVQNEIQSHDPISEQLKQIT
jgi:hypothetical protein